MSPPLSRRALLHNGLSFVALSPSIPSSLMQAATPRTAPERAAGGSDGKILVVVELAGGNDGLNTVVPHTDRNYARVRPTIGLPARDLVAVGPNLGLHPRLKPLSALYEQGHLAIVNGVGYPHPNRSHFQAMDIWQTADVTLDARDRTGWLARCFDREGHPRTPLSGLSVSGALPLALSSEHLVASVYNENSALFEGEDPDRQRRREALQALYAQGTVANSNAEFARNIGINAYAVMQEIKRALKAGDDRKSMLYPPNNDFAASLQTVSRLITGGLETRVYYLSLGGFDTHANQADTHANLLGTVGDGLAAFYKDLAAQGRAQDVTTVTYSEFGRRAQENGGAGTDHGAASVLFVLGGAVRGGLYGDYPGLADLDDGDLRFHTDFRQVYATLLDRWLGSPSKSILGGTFHPLGFL